MNNLPEWMRAGRRVSDLRDDEIPYVHEGYPPFGCIEQLNLSGDDWFLLVDRVKALHAAQQGKPSAPEAPAEKATPAANTVPQKPHENPMLTAAKKLNAKFEVRNVR